MREGGAAHSSRIRLGCWTEPRRGGRWRVSLCTTRSPPLPAQLTSFAAPPSPSRGREKGSALLPPSPRRFLPLQLRPLLRPLHDAERVGAFGEIALAREDAAAHRDAGRVHGLRIARDQRMPPFERLALGEAAIGAGGRQPLQALG